MGARSAQEIWEAALGELQIQVNRPNYRTWLDKTVGISYHDSQFVVGVPNTFVAEYLDRNQRSLIEKTLIGLTHQDIKVLFQVDGRQQNSTDNYSARTEVPVATQPSQYGLNPKYTFDSFIVGSSNRLAHAAALEVAENPQPRYNPLFIFGRVGLGKTHILHAIAHAALANNVRVLYVSAEQFTNELTNALRERKAEEFRHKYRSVEMLLIDDIQFIGGKEQTEENFFHTFNELHNANHQIIITSNCHPKSIPLLQERLRSRFEWGLIADIEPPDFETRLAILQAKAEQHKANATLDVLELIAHQAQQNIRELEGCLNRVIAYAKLIRATLTTELAGRVLEGIASKSTPNASVSPRQLIEAVADTFQISPLNLKSRKKDKQTVLARQAAMYLLKQEYNYSLAQIGHELGGRSPSTVTHAYEKIVTGINNDPYLRRRILAIQQRLRPELNIKDF